MHRFLIIVTGPPASGKTTVSQRLAADLELPLLGRDAIKERLFDTLGWSDRAWSARVGAASYRLLYQTLELLLQTGRLFIVESNFSAAHDAPQLRNLCTYYQYRSLQLCCTAPIAVLNERYIRRTNDGTRHAGHADSENIPNLRTDAAAATPDLLDLAGDYRIVDTTSEETLNYPVLLEAIRQRLASM
jgi:predicted kinase